MSNENARYRELPAELEVLSLLARDVLGRISPEQRARGEAAVQGHLTRARKRRPAWVVPALAAAAVGLLASTAIVKHRAKAVLVPLSYVVENGNSPSDQSLDVGGGLPRIARFSDGTEVRVDKGTQARVRFVTDHGAALAMSHGALHAAVVHSPTSEWRFDAGPFVVHVTGTEFGLSWDPDQDRFDLRMEHGSVTVTSPVANDPIPVRAGQWLTIRARSNQVFIRDLTGQDQSEPAQGVDAVLPADEASSASSAEAQVPARSAPDAGHHWAQDLARGKVEGVVNDALRRGLDGCLAEASGSELAALADAARYTRRDEIARKALLTERRRFAGSRQAAAAGLLLGRLAEAEHDEGQALSWFNTYLAEAPNGPYASEALGRKMAIVRHTIGTAAARTVAEEYLAKYADGAYASAARAILKNP